MELFDEKGCLTDEGLQALTGGQLDEMGRLEAAEHLAYCDRCMDCYTALLTEDALETPPRPARGAVMSTIFVRLMQNTWGRAAVAGIAAVLALTMWRSGALSQLMDVRDQVKSWLPASGQSQTAEKLPQLGRPVQDDDRRPAAPETLGKPVDDPEPKQSADLVKTLNRLLFGSQDRQDRLNENQQK